MHKSVGMILALAAVAGCASSVKVIGPVAAQGEQNAKALEHNLARFAEDIDPLVRAAVDARVVKHYNDVYHNVLNTDAPPTGEELLADKVRAHYDGLAATLKQVVDALPTPEAKAATIAALRESRPLPAAMAFDGVSKEDAAFIWKKVFDVYSTYSALNKPLEMHDEYCAAVRTLPVLKEAEASRTLVLDSYRTLSDALRTQASNGVLISSQLLQASRTDADPHAFLRGVAESPQTLEAIATTVGKFGNQKQQAAATKLLESLKTTNGTPNPK